MKQNSCTTSNYKAIIYDIDGTLLDTFPMNFYPLIRIVKEELGIDMAYEEALRFAPCTGMETMRLLGIKDVDTVYARWVRYVNEYEEPAAPYPGIEALLEYCEGRLMQAIVTSKKREQYHIDMKNLEHYFSVAVLEDDTVNHKPDPEPLLKAIALLQLSPEDVLYIGDAYSDYECAMHAGVDFGHALWGSLIDPIAEAAYHLTTPEDIMRLVRTSL